MEGLSTIPSKHGPKETMDRLEEAVRSLGIAVFARIDHAAGAAEAGLDLRPTEVLIFGNPRAGTPLMQAGQTIGLDLPLRALVWKDESDKTWLSYLDPAWLAQRHGLNSPATLQVAEKLAAVLNKLANSATGNE